MTRQLPHVAPLFFCPRSVAVDPFRLLRCQRAPEYGPRILFFTGGTGLKGTSRELKRFTHNTVHITTPFDSGGSSQKIRRCFGMLSVGDLRNRLMALADESEIGNPETYNLFSHRLPMEAAPDELWRQLRDIIEKEDGPLAVVPAPLRAIIRVHLSHLIRRLPEDFDLRGASIGNLLLTGAYLSYDRDIAAVVGLFEKLVAVRGTVLPVTDVDHELAAELHGGEVVVGQHRITGKEVPPLRKQIVRLFVVASEASPEPVTVEASDRCRALIASANLICFPMGSFFTSLLATLLPHGIGRAVAAARCPKIFVPGTGDDPERFGHDLNSCLAMLLRTLRSDAPLAPTEALLNGVLLDRSDAIYGTFSIPPGEVCDGIPLLRTDLAKEGDGRLDPKKLASLLLSLA